MIPFPQLSRFADLVRDHPFRLVKSVPKFPHFYTLRKYWPTVGAFDECVDFIGQYGLLETFYAEGYAVGMDECVWRGKKIHVNGYQYWATSSIYNKGEILINRAEAKYSSDYCGIATTYDAIFNNDESEIENEQVMDALGDVQGHRILDIGSGTGLFLDYRSSDVRPADYVGVEPSLAMGRVFASKHPDFAGCVVPTHFESFADGKFDLVLSTFGSMSYVRPDHVGRVLDMLNPGGRYFLMFYQTGYKPVSCVQTGIDSHHYMEGASLLKSQVKQPEAQIVDIREWQFSDNHVTPPCFVVSEGRCGKSP